MSEDLIKEILAQLRELDHKVSMMATEYALREERYNVLTASFKERTKHIEELMGVMNQGKTAAKLIAGFIAILAGIGAAWDWIVSHIRIL